MVQALTQAFGLDGCCVVVHKDKPDLPLVQVFEPRCAAGYFFVESTNEVATLFPDMRTAKTVLSKLDNKDEFVPCPIKGWYAVSTKE